MEKILNRIFDVFLALFFLLLLTPFIFLISFLVKISSNGPIIHWSKRVGKHGRLFLMPKFRTMLLGTEVIASNKLINSKKKITLVGKFLRRLSLDEVLQFYSVLKGEMSIVGPRPALYNQKYLIKRRRKLGIDQVNPGITGLAQINGRDRISINKKIYYDYQYLLNKNFILDIIIILKTLYIIFDLKKIKH
jgi:O-antigen biosynthesis protein WbqP